MRLEDDKEKLPQGWRPGPGHPLTPPHPVWRQRWPETGQTMPDYAESPTQILSVCKTCHLITNQATLPGIREGRGTPHAHTQTYTQPVSPPPATQPRPACVLSNP